MKKKVNPVFTVARKNSYVANLRTGTLVNLAGSYDYLELAYYMSQDFEYEGKAIYPGCGDMIDAYVTPVMLVKARRAGIPVPEYYITNGYFETPVIVDTANPFMLRSRIVVNQQLQQRVAKSMTRNFKYAICCQELPAGSKVKYFRSVLGWCLYEKYRAISARVWEVFRIPLAKVRLVILQDGTMLLSDIGPLPFEKLSARELEFLSKEISWPE